MNASEGNSERSRGPLEQNAAPIVQPHSTGTRLVESLARLTASPDAIRALPPHFVQRHRILPLAIRDGTIHIATAEPGNQRVVDDIRLLSGFEVQEFEAPASEILERIGECYQVTVEKLMMPEPVIVTGLLTAPVPLSCPVVVIAAVPVPPSVPSTWSVPEIVSLGVEIVPL